jgi:spermidine/putrescine transport system substrate-binding protein
MKLKSFFLAFSLAVLFAPGAMADDKQLFIYTWDTYADQDLFKKFEKETGIKVVTDIYSSNDTLIAKLKSGAAYDIVAPSGNYVPLLVAENLLMPLPEDLRAYGDKLAANVQRPGYDPEYKYVLPLFYGTTGVAVNTKLVKEDVTSWNQFFARPEGEKKQLGMLDDTSTVMDIVAIALGKDYCEDKPETYKSLQGLLEKQKPFVKTYSSTGYSERLAANEVTMQLAWSGDVYRVRQDNPDIKYVYPKEGVEVWVDNLGIPAASKNVEAAKKFVEFVMKPENMAQYSQYSGNVPSLAAAMDKLPDEFRNAPEFNIPSDVKGVVSITCPAKVVKSYEKIWERVLR